MNQQDIEFKYSKKHIQSNIIDFINMNTLEFINMGIAINDYMFKEYSYESKTKRIAQFRSLDIPIDEIALEILSIVLPVQEITPIQGLCTKLGNVFKFKNQLDGVKTAAELFAITEGYYFELYAHDYYENKTGTMGIKSLLPLDPELQSLLEQVHYIPPMVETPVKWKENIGGGYQTITESCILKSRNHHWKNQSLDVLNILQDVQSVLNTDILELEELPKHSLETPQQKEQFNKWARDSRKIYEMYKDKPFYFVWKNDARGRMYSQGYHINFQSMEYKRALIDSNKKQVCTI